MIDHMLQCLLVLTPDWDAVEGSMFLFERQHIEAAWQQVEDPIPVDIGRKGMGWGRGVHPAIEPRSNPVKKEGDLKTPAGIYALGPVFGYPEKPDNLKMDFLLIDDQLECVDDPLSLYYNQFVRPVEGEVKEWKSSEQMTHPLYCCGLVIAHNTQPPVPGLGSCIFMHCLRTKGFGTAGCTAMEEHLLRKVLAWLDSSKHPHIVQLPLEQYDKLRDSWKLPKVSESLSLK
jgi:L,D-peptidoglycan transpeptidase YkuD (ErfK/YbiS/YcfS/YnhG family)